MIENFLIKQLKSSTCSVEKDMEKTLRNAKKLLDDALEMYSDEQADKEFLNRICKDSSRVIESVEKDLDEIEQIKQSIRRIEEEIRNGFQE